jgi:hypothetical protein
VLETKDREMKKALTYSTVILPPIIIGATIMLWAGSAHAHPPLETYECGATKPLENETDPIVKIIMRIAVSASSSDVQIFDVDHYAASGKVYSRQEQYNNRRFWIKDGETGWTGTSVKMPRQGMFGKLTVDNYYVEQRFIAGTLRSKTTSACRVIDFAKPEKKVSDVPPKVQESREQWCEKWLIRNDLNIPDMRATYFKNCMYTLEQHRIPGDR